MAEKGDDKVGEKMLGAQVASCQAAGQIDPAEERDDCEKQGDVANRVVAVGDQAKGKNTAKRSKDGVRQTKTNLAEAEIQSSRQEQKHQGQGAAQRKTGHGQRTD